MTATPLRVRSIGTARAEVGLSAAVHAAGLATRQRRQRRSAPPTRSSGPRVASRFSAKRDTQEPAHYQTERVLPRRPPQMAQKSMEALGRGSPGAPPRQAPLRAPLGWPGRRVRRVPGVHGDPVRRHPPTAVAHGPVQVPKADGDEGTLLESTAGGPGGRGVAGVYQPGIDTSCSSGWAWPTCSGTSRPTRSQVRYVNEGTAHVRCRGCPGGRGQAREHARLSARWWSR